MILLFVSLLLFSSGLEEDTLFGQLLGCPLLSSLVKKFKTYSVSTGQLPPQLHVPLVMAVRLATASLFQHSVLSVINFIAELCIIFSL